MTVKDLWCKFKGHQGGTIHQALYDFRWRSWLKDQKAFVAILNEHMDSITDKEHAKEFIQIRIQHPRLDEGWLSR